MGPVLIRMQLFLKHILKCVLKSQEWVVKKDQAVLPCLDLKVEDEDVTFQSRTKRGVSSFQVIKVLVTNWCLSTEEGQVEVCDFSSRS